MNSHRRPDSDQIAEAVRLGQRSYLIRLLVAISGCAVLSAALLAGSLVVRGAVGTGTSPDADPASFNIPAGSGTAIATNVPTTTTTGPPASIATDPTPMTLSTETVTTTTPASTATVTTWKTPGTETVRTGIPARTETVVLTKEVDKIGTVIVTELSTTTETTTVVKVETVTVSVPQ
jgi:hypothetical protein